VTGGPGVCDEKRVEVRLAEAETLAASHVANARRGAPASAIVITSLPAVSPPDNGAMGALAKRAFRRAAFSAIVPSRARANVADSL
jgi:hypothetical protein